MQMMGDLGEDMDLMQVAQALPEPEDLLESEDDAPIIRLINALLTEASRKAASDIHIEAFENRLVVRFRVDGVLREVLEPPRQSCGALLVSRIKVMAQLDIAEKRLPQDGRISLRVAGRAVDVRVSTLPSGMASAWCCACWTSRPGASTWTTSVWRRRPRGHRPPDQQAARHRAGHRPDRVGQDHHAVCGAGPLNNKRRNIMTVEDPIEYYFDGIGQTQVNTKVEMSFARGLRAILRQDPDVVMVGEIRDLETAEIAVQASLTGHLVFSTLHTNSAVGAVTRLRDMGVRADFCCRPAWSPCWHSGWCGCCVRIARNPIPRAVPIAWPWESRWMRHRFCIAPRVAQPVKSLAIGVVPAFTSWPSSTLPCAP